MTVKQLIRQLKRLPQDYDITIDNTDLFINGTYKVDSVEVDDNDKQVGIVSEYIHRWDCSLNKWKTDYRED